MRPFLRGVTIAGLLSAAVLPLTAQSTDHPPVTVANVTSVAAAGVVLVVPRALNWHARYPSCAPCDRESIPFFDRWAVANPRAGFSTASDLLRAGLAIASWIDLAGNGRAGQSAIAASVESLAWTEALTHLFKNVAARNRPVMYTDQAVSANTSSLNHRSMPSGHTSTAFAIATSYWLSQRHLDHPGPAWVRWALLAGATGVGVLRVAAAKHFPSDVVTGAAVGIGTTILVHTIRF